MEQQRTLDDILLIECVENRRELYDPEHYQYMDVNHKMAVWKEIGVEVQADSYACKQRWSNIRDNFRKSLRKSIYLRKKGSKAVKHYKYSDHLDFLRRIFVGDENWDNLGDPHVLPYVDVKLEDASFVQIDFQDPFSDEDSPVQSSRKKGGTNQDATEQSQTSANSSSQPHTTQKCESRSREAEDQAPNISHHSVDAFLAGLAPTLKTFSPLNWHHAKSEIFAVVQKYELKTIKGDGGEEACLK